MGENSLSVGVLPWRNRASCRGRGEGQEGWQTDSELYWNKEFQWVSDWMVPSFIMIICQVWFVNSCNSCTSSTHTLLVHLPLGFKTSFAFFDVALMVLQELCRFSPGVCCSSLRPACVTRGAGQTDGSFTEQPVEVFSPHVPSWGFYFPPMPPVLCIHQGNTRSDVFCLCEVRGCVRPMWITAGCEGEVPADSAVWRCLQRKTVYKHAHPERIVSCK